MSRGVIYIGTGDQYVNEAIKSARSVQEHMPDIGVAIATHMDPQHDIFDEVIEIDHLHDDCGESVIRPNMMPFEKMLYLDTDTRICEPIPEVFEVLDHYDIAAAHAPNRTPVPGTPDIFTEYNTGVVAYSRSDDTRQFLHNWREEYDKQRKEDGIKADQPAFAKAAYNSNVKFYTLQPEYNIRTHVWGFALYGPKIVHGRHEDMALDEVATKLGESAPSVFWPHIRGDYPRVFNADSRVRSPRAAPFALLDSVKRNGVQSAVKKAAGHLRSIL